MAKPIRATPTLVGDDAVRFIKTMLKEEREPTKCRVDFIKNAIKHTKDYERMLDEVVELRRKDYSISRITEILGVPMANVLRVLSETQIDEELYPANGKEEAEQEKLIEKLAK